MNDDDVVRIDRLDNAVFGNRDNPKGQPGIVNEIVRLSDRQKETNEILKEVQGDLRRVVWIVLGAVLTGLLAMVVRGFTPFGGS